MPRNYRPDPRSKRHVSYKKEDIEKALEEDINNLSFRAAGVKHNIEHTVLFRRKCSGHDVLVIEFICRRCLEADSDDSLADEDFNPIKSGYGPDDDESSE